jgi:hypothetical protein
MRVGVVGGVTRADPRRLEAIVSDRSAPQRHVAQIILATADGCGTTEIMRRSGKANLFAALNVLDSAIVGRNMKRHRRQEFIRFLSEVDAQVPKRKAIHAIVPRDRRQRRARLAGDGGKANSEQFTKPTFRNQRFDAVL